MQTLYEWEFRSTLDIQEIMERNIHEFEKDVDTDYIEKVVKGVLEKWGIIDDLILKAAPEWPVEQIAPVDKNVLRVAIFEMIYDASGDVPPRVSINEAIEIGKTFGSESSSKFINGVLGYVYRQNEKQLKARDKK